MAVLHETGAVGVVQQKKRQRKALVPLALGLACGIGWLFCRGPSVGHETDAFVSGSGTVAQLLNPGLLKVVQTHFPGAKSSYRVLPKVLKALRPYGLRPKLVMYGTSICPDEINNEPTTLSTLMTNHYGKVFPLGGLGGVPFSGKTGFSAFSHHVPTNGHVVVMFGPHLGMSSGGEPGKFMRLGQATISSACGAATAAYAQLTSGQTIKADASDTQQCWLREKLAPEMAAIKQAPEPVVELYYKLYKIIEKEIFTIVNTAYGRGKLVLLGGITINMPHPMPAYFLPLHFSIRSEGQAPMDLMGALA